MTRDYKNYVLSVSEVERGRWEGQVQRKDGQNITIDGTTMAVFKTAYAQSPNEAAKLAEQAIDAMDTKRISPKGWT
jgi:hypothetical protein